MTYPGGGQPWQPPSPQAPPPRDRRRVGTKVALGVVVVAVAAAGVVVATKLINTSVTTGRPRTAPDVTATPASCLRQESGLDNGLAGSLTLAMQKHDKTAFLALGSTDVARATMSMWWDNVSAIGFTTGGAQAVSEDRPIANSVKMQVGFHNALDSITSNTGKQSTPDAPATEYQLSTTTVRDAGNSSTCHLSVAGWKSLANAPWDGNQKLYVVKTKHVVIAGEQPMKSEVNRIAPVAEKAAAWNFGFFQHNGKAGYINQGGFVLFVPSTPEQEQGWFRAATAKKPKGWLGDVGVAGGFAFPLQGVALPASSSLPAGFPKLAPITSRTGGARTLITAVGRHYGLTDMEGVLVHEFVHLIYSNYDISYYLGGDPTGGAVVEGAARLIQAYFLNSPASPVTGPGGGRPVASAYLKAGLRSHFASFNDRWPTDAQIYGAQQTADYYYDLSATTFGYEAATSGVAFALQCMRDAYLNAGGPFSGVVVSIKGSTITFADPKTEQARWAAWLRRFMSN